MTTWKNKNNSQQIKNINNNHAKLKIKNIKTKFILKLIEIKLKLKRYTSFEHGNHNIVGYLRNQQSKEQFMVSLKEAGLLAITRRGECRTSRLKAFRNDHV